MSNENKIIIEHFVCFSSLKVEREREIWDVESFRVDLVESHNLDFVREIFLRIREYEW